MAGLSPDLADFLARLHRLDPQALVRIRPEAGGVAVWARVPWGVLVTRVVPVPAVGDRTVRAADWLALGDDDPSALGRRDADWRVSLPGGAAVTLESLPADVIRRISAAAASTLRETAVSGIGGRPVGARMLRDALLDHVPIVVTPDHPEGAAPVPIPQRLVQAVTRMGLLAPENPLVHVIGTGGWIGISTGRGIAWWRQTTQLSVHTHRA